MLMELPLCTGNALQIGRRLIFIYRAAEIGSIECAKILLEYNADIDAVNFLG